MKTFHNFSNEGFDCGPGLTLAACLRHASRAVWMVVPYYPDSGERVSNTRVTCPWEGDNKPKGLLIPHIISEAHALEMKGGLWFTMLPPKEGLLSYQVVGGVMAYQAYDG